MNMSEAKPIASLSSVLLARKGGARPAMRRPVINNTGGVALVQDDLGWNDMGYDVDPDPNAPMDYEHDIGHNLLANAVPEATPDMKIQQDRIAEQLHAQAENVTALHLQEAAEPAQVVPIAPAKQPVFVTPPSVFRSKTPDAASGRKSRTAFTLRLDSDRHLRLRLACAVTNKSAQQLVTYALDVLMDSMSEIDAFATQLPAREAQNAE
jgi:hypothetical protein